MVECLPDPTSEPARELGQEGWRRGFLAALFLTGYWLAGVYLVFPLLFGEDRPRLWVGITGSIFFGVAVGLGPVLVRRLRDRLAGSKPHVLS